MKVRRYAESACYPIRHQALLQGERLIVSNIAKGPSTDRKTTDLRNLQSSRHKHQRPHLCSEKCSPNTRRRRPLLEPSKTLPQGILTCIERYDLGLVELSFNCSTLSTVFGGSCAHLSSNLRERSNITRSLVLLALPGPCSRHLPSRPNLSWQNPSTFRPLLEKRGEADTSPIMT